MTNEQIDDVFQKIFTIISRTSPNSIENIVNASNKRKIMYHGIKKHRNIARIVRLGGRLPTTIESGPCSFWSTGLALFLPTADSPMFRYTGGASLVDPDVCRLNLAMCSYDLLSAECSDLPEYEEDSQIIINETVPYRTMVLLSINVKHPHVEHPSKVDIPTLRGYRQAAEQMLLRAIEKQLFEEFTPGKTMKKTIKYF